MKRAEVLGFEGCPNVAPALARVREAIAETDEAWEVRLVLIHDEDEAVRLRFLGSPSVRVDGVDVDASARAREDYGLRCRVYPSASSPHETQSSEKRLVGVPPLDWIVEALRSA